MTVPQSLSWKKQQKPATAGQRAGSPWQSFSDDSHFIAQKHAAAQVRLRHLASRLHRLGEAPLYHFLTEIEAGADLRSTLEAYAELPADLIKAYRGDRFREPFAIRKVRRP